MLIFVPLAMLFVYLLAGVLYSLPFVVIGWLGANLWQGLGWALLLGLAWMVGRRQ